MPQVTIKRTPVSMAEYARAVLAACRSLGWEPLTKAAAGVLWAQYMIETGGAACWNWNLGNVKVTQGQVDAGASWIDLPGTWEVIAGKRVVLPEGHPGRRFRAYESLADGMVEHLLFLRNKRYQVAWPAVLAGDCMAFARLLKSAGYFTASAEDYGAGMGWHFRRWMASDVYDAAERSVRAAQEAETLRELPDLGHDPDITPEPSRIHCVEDFAVVHPPVPLGRPALDGELPRYEPEPDDPDDPAAA